MSRDKLDDVWNVRDFPVLREVVRRMDAVPGLPVQISELASATDLSESQARRAVANLARDDLVKFDGVAEEPILYVSEFSGDALRVAGMWPSPDNALERMLAALEQLAEHGATSDDRTRARKILDGLKGASRQVTIGVATAVITGQLPK